MPMSSKTQTMATKAVFTGGAMQAADNPRREAMLALGFKGPC